VVLLSNLGFPLIGSFLSELYLVLILGGITFIVFRLQYILIRIVHINMYFKIKGYLKVEVKGWIALFLLLY